jgi:transposase InsO family protein
VEKDGFEVIKGNHVDGLYHVDFVSATGTGNEDVVCLYSGVKPKADLMSWHKRTGHLNFADLRKLANLADGISLSTSTVPVCHTCNLMKMTKQRFNDTPHFRAKVPLELIHTDLAGPFPRSKGGNQYIMTFIDDFSNYAYTYFLKSKDEAFKTFQEYQAEVERFTGKKIRALRSDGGGEYISNNFSAHLKHCGIQHQLTAPHTPSQNGVAERYNRTLKSAMRSIMRESTLSTNFWADAIAYVNYTRNRSPSSAVPDKIPYELWTGHRANISHLRPFGSEAYALILPDTLHQPLGPRAWHCRLLGYAPGRKAYKLWDLENHVIRISHHVRFVEPQSDLPTSTNVNFEESPDSYLFDNDDDDDATSDGGNSDVGGDDPPPPAGGAGGDDGNGDENAPAPGGDDAGGAGAGDGDGDNEPQGGGDDGDDGLLDLADGDPDLANFYNPAKNHGFIHLPPKDKKRKRQPRVRTYLSATGPDIQLAKDPTSVHDALNGPYSEHWHRAMLEEWESLVKMETFKLADLPPGRAPIGCKWVLTVKRDEAGRVVRFKARLVARGFTQTAGVDYKETFASVVKFSSIRMIFALAAQLDLTVYQVDIKTAFLNGELDETIYMDQPSEFDDGSGRVLDLHRALYGLKQASRAWYQKLRSILEGMGFTRADGDPAVFLWRRGDSVIIIPSWVDDLLGASNDPSAWQEFLQKLRGHVEITDMGVAHYYLGVQVDHDHKSKTLRISQKQYVTDLLEEFGFQDCTPVSTPLPPNIHLTKDMCPSTEAEKTQMRDVPYLRLVGRLMYLMLFTRPDLCHAVGLLSRFGSNPGWEHWMAAKRVLRYLKGTTDYGITYRQSSLPFEVTCYTDADWGEDPDTRRSISGMVSVLAGGAVSWSSKRQSTVAQSTLEAEYMAAASATKEVLWLRKMLADIGQPPTVPTVIWCDNQGAITTSKDDAFHPRTKHIDQKYHLVREKVEAGNITVLHKPTTEMAADFFTKSLPREKLERLIPLIGLGTR